MPFLKPRDAVLHYTFRPGDPARRAIVFANSLGTDLRIWDGVVARLPTDIPVLTHDKRGHGLSDVTDLDMATHIHDCADLMDHLGLRDALICGVSVGGLIAQGLAATRPDLVAGLVLSNTAHRIGDAESWNARIARVTAEGLEGMAHEIMARWFSSGFRTASPAEWAGYRNMLLRTPAPGYIATCAAIRDTDFTASTRALRLPVTCISGSADQATPPALVQGMAELIEGATLHCLTDIGHLPCIETPDTVAGLVLDRYGRLP
jgi:3-oxoadipate enol-lactonase